MLSPKDKSSKLAKTPEPKLLTQTTDALFLVKPDTFGFNPQTADSNTFQHIPDASEKEVQTRALQEFETIVATLKYEDIKVLTLPSPVDKLTPDAVFPNNWVTTHRDGTMILFPMFTPNRRDERQPQALHQLLAANGFKTTRTIDLTHYENNDLFLEATGSLVLDRADKVAFAIESPRTSLTVFEEFCRVADFEPVFFHAADENGIPVYHTNIIMALGDGFCVLCTESIPDETEHALVTQKIDALGLELINISFGQLRQFCGNCLQVRSQSGEPKIIMSQTAHDNFTKDQIDRLAHYGKLVPLTMPTIETVGGGSARCILAEIFLPKNQRE